MTCVPTLLLAWMMVFAVPLLGAGLQLINKQALNIGMNFHILVLYRNLIATCLLVPSALYFDRGAIHEFRLRWRNIGICFLGLALLEPVLNQNLAFAGLLEVTASLSSAVGLLTPVLTFFFSWLWRLEPVVFARRASRAKLVGATVGVVGVVVLLCVPENKVIYIPHTRASSHKLGTNNVEGVFYCLLAVVCGAAYNTLSRKLMATYNRPLTIAATTCTIGTIVNIPIALHLGHNRYGLKFDWTFAAYTYSGIMVSALGTYIAIFASGVLGPVVVSSVSLLSAVIVTVVGVSVLHEELTVVRLISGLVILGAIGCMIWGKSKETEEEKQKPVARLQPEEAI